MKKFIDLLFEPEEENKGEVLAEGPLEDVKAKHETIVKAKIEPKANVQSKKSETRHSFIDLDELKTPKTRKKESKENKKAYEFHKPISPVFGYIGENTKNDYVLHTPQLKENAPSALGTIISPYYGPCNKKDNVKQEEIKDVLPNEKIGKEKPKINLTTVINRPLENVNYCKNVENKSLLKDEKEEEIADTEISLFDELFSSSED